MLIYNIGYITLTGGIAPNSPARLHIPYICYPISFLRGFLISVGSQVRMTILLLWRKA